MEVRLISYVPKTASARPNAPGSECGTVNVRSDFGGPSAVFWSVRVSEGYNIGALSVDEVDGGATVESMGA